MFLIDSVNVPEGAVLPRTIYDTARPELQADWAMWSQRLSVPADLAGRLPLAINGEDIMDPPEIRECLKISIGSYIIFYIEVE